MITCKQQVAILLATYNGEKYLCEQIDSIISQSFTDWHLYIHDDGSNDNTVKIALSYQERIPDKISLLTYPRQGGARNNFFSLIESVEADYYAFCDQDDIWHKDKIKLCLEAIKKEENKNAELPYFSFCNLRIVDESDHVIHADFWDTCQLYPEMYQKLSHYVSFFIPGCTIMINHKAWEIRGDYTNAFMHDGWFMIRVLAEGGKVICVPMALMDYRQHSTNAVGVDSCYKQITWRYRLKNFYKLFQTHVKTYRMLHASGYPNVMKYIINKIRENIVRRRIHIQKAK